MSVCLSACLSLSRSLFFFKKVYTSHKPGFDFPHHAWAQHTHTHQGGGHCDMHLVHLHCDWCLESGVCLINAFWLWVLCLVLLEHYYKVATFRYQHLSWCYKIWCFEVIHPVVYMLTIKANILLSNTIVHYSNNQLHILSCNKAIIRLDVKQCYLSLSDISEHKVPPPLWQDCNSEIVFTTVSKFNSFF